MANNIIEKDYIDFLRLQIRITELFYFDLLRNKLTHKEVDFLALCMHIKILGHAFTSDEAFVLFDLNGWRDMLYLYWNDRLLAKGWVTDKLYKNKGNADISEYLGIVLGRMPKGISFDFYLKLKQTNIEDIRNTGDFRNLPR